MTLDRQPAQRGAQYRGLDAAPESALRRRAAVSFSAAVVLTCFVSAAFWYSARLLSTEADRLQHASLVMNSLTEVAKDIVDMETGARGYVLSGEETYLEPFTEGKRKLPEELERLEQLIRDSPTQQQQWSRLKEQIQAAMEAKTQLVVRRRSQAPFDVQLLAEGKKRVDAARATIQEMQVEETRLSGEHFRKTIRSRRLTNAIAFLGASAGLGVLALIWFSLRKQIELGGAARSEISRFNVELEQRVSERTAELEASNHSLQNEIQARAEAEHSLRESEERLAGVIGSAMDAIITVDGGQRILLFNAAAEKMFGCQAAEAMGESVERFLPERFRARHAEHIQRFAETGTTSREMGTLDAIWGKRTNGEEFPIEASISQISNGGKKLFTVILRDITQRKKAEEQLVIQAEELSWQADDLMRTKESLRAQSEIFALVLNSVGEGLVAADENGKFLLWNPAAERILGRGQALIPMAEWSEYYDVYLPDGVTPFPAAQLPLVRAMKGEDCEVELVVHNPLSGKATWVEATAHPLRDVTGACKGGVVALRDASQRKSDEREIRRLNENLELRVAQRTAELQAANQELEAFTYSVSHDLRAPLRHISGFARILIEDFANSLPEEVQQHLTRIEQGTIRMGRLVDELLNLTRVGRQSLSVQVTGLGSIVEDVVAMLSPEVEERAIAGRPVEWKIGELPFAECDPTLIRLVFQNLISNALKYSRPRARARIEIGKMEKDKSTVIFVRDNGVGFSMKYADKLFGVFQRLHRAEDFEGTGVGLATVHRIIQKHGGKIWAEAEMDRGACFYFTLSGLGRPAGVRSAVTAGGQL